MDKIRIEKDAIGKVKVPNNAYFGSFTVRAKNNFKISGLKAPKEFKEALGIIKKSAVLTNKELKEIDAKEAGAIKRACDEFLSGKFDSEFSLDIFQAGAGTPFNMNINEIIANRANEILNVAKGSYSPITPNNHVNWGQSTNDVIPTAIKIASLIKLKTLLSEIKKLEESFNKKATQFKNIIKIGRTHLQDAVPMTLEQEFSSYSTYIKKAHDQIKHQFEQLQEIHIGGTALGTGITAHPKYKTLMVKNLNKLTNLNLKSTQNPTELNSNMNMFANASNSLQTLANSLIKISNDLIILSSGPKGGINEISLPEVEPGSSIMPGKINPSIPECVNMVAFQVIGNNLTINLAQQHSHLELNTMTPVIMHNLLFSMEILENVIKIFRTKCVNGIKANKKNIEKLLNESLCISTALSPYLGYKVTALLVNEALKTNKSLYQVVEEKNFMKPSELKKILSIKTLTSPTTTDKSLVKQIKTNKIYINFLKKT